ncbi:MAG: DUF892 family protein [Thermomicrobiales bacterium]
MTQVLNQSLQEGMMGAAVRAGPGGLVTGSACETEHLEIAVFTGLVKKARAVGMTGTAQLLQQNLQEAQQMLQHFEQIAQQLSQQMAAKGGSLNQGASASVIQQEAVVGSRRERELPPAASCLTNLLRGYCGRPGETIIYFAPGTSQCVVCHPIDGGLHVTAHTFDDVTRMSGTDRRRAMLALGAAGLASVVAGSFGASAKQSAGKKAKKKCNKQKKACQEDLVIFCAQFGGGAQECLAALTPCCASCNLSDAVLCTANVFNTVMAVN